MDSDNKEASPRIEPMKKVILSIAVGTTPAHMDLTPQPFRFEFIHGLGTTGLSPFEQMLINKGPGDTIGMSMPVNGQRQFMGHLVIPPILLPAGLGELHLEVQVEKVLTASGREIVRGLANIAACGDDCCGH